MPVVGGASGASAHAAPGSGKSSGASGSLDRGLPGRLRSASVGSRRALIPGGADDFAVFPPADPAGTSKKLFSGGAPRAAPAASAVVQPEAGGAAGRVVGVGGAGGARGSVGMYLRSSSVGRRPPGAAGQQLGRVPPAFSAGGAHVLRGGAVLDVATAGAAPSARPAAADAGAAAAATAAAAAATAAVAAAGATAAVTLDPSDSGQEVSRPGVGQLSPALSAAERSASVLDLAPQPLCTLQAGSTQPLSLSSPASVGSRGTPISGGLSGDPSLALSPSPPGLLLPAGPSYVAAESPLIRRRLVLDPQQQCTTDSADGQLDYDSAGVLDLAHRQLRILTCQEEGGDGECSDLSERGVQSLLEGHFLSDIAGQARRVAAEARCDAVGHIRTADSALVDANHSAYAVMAILDDATPGQARLLRAAAWPLGLVLAAVEQAVAVVHREAAVVVSACDTAQALGSPTMDATGCAVPSAVGAAREASGAVSAAAVAAEAAARSAALLGAGLLRVSVAAGEVLAPLAPSPTTRDAAVVSWGDAHGPQVHLHGGQCGCGVCLAAEPGAVAVFVGLAAQGQAQALAAVALLPELLSTVDATQQHQILGELLYPLVVALVPEAAGKVTGMFLELGQSTVLRLLGDPVALAASVQEAVVVIAADLAAAEASAAAPVAPTGAPRDAAVAGPESALGAAHLLVPGVVSGSGGPESDADSGLPVVSLESLCAALQLKVAALEKEATRSTALASKAASAAAALLSTSMLKVAKLERQLGVEKALVASLRGQHAAAMEEQVLASAAAQDEMRQLIVRKYEAAASDSAAEFGLLAASEAAARRVANRYQFDVDRLMADGAALRGQVIAHEELLALFLESGTGTAPASRAAQTPPVAAAVVPQPGVGGVAAVKSVGDRRPVATLAPAAVLGVAPTLAGAASGVALPPRGSGRHSADATVFAAPVEVATGSRFSVLLDDDPGDGVGSVKVAGAEVAVARVVAPAAGQQLVLDRANVTDLAGTPAWSGSRVRFLEPRPLPTPRVVARQHEPQQQRPQQQQQRPQQQRPQKQQQQRSPLSPKECGVQPGEVLPQRPSGWRETSRVFHSFKQRWKDAKERGLLGAALEAAVGMTERELQRLGRIVRDADPRHALRSPHSAPSRRTLATVESVLGRTGLVAADGGRAG